jgi:hypothetical protein
LNSFEGKVWPVPLHQYIITWAESNHFMFFWLYQSESIPWTMRYWFKTLMIIDISLS